MVTGTPPGCRELLMPPSALGEVSTVSSGCIWRGGLRILWRHRSAPYRTCEAVLQIPGPTRPTSGIPLVDPSRQCPLSFAIPLRLSEIIWCNDAVNAPLSGVGSNQCLPPTWPRKSSPRTYDQAAQECDQAVLSESATAIRTAPHSAEPLSHSH